MLTINIPPKSVVDDEGNITKIPGATLQLEHSLVSVSKWESKWHVPFLTKEKKSVAQIKDYIRCMTITQNVKAEVYDNIGHRQIAEIQKYIDDPHTATTFSSYSQGGRHGGKEIMTSELIYYYMTALNIPFECQKWNFNRLMVLIKIAAIKNDPKGKKRMSNREIYSQNAALNAARRAASGSKG